MKKSKSFILMIAILLLIATCLFFTGLSLAGVDWLGWMGSRQAILVYLIILVVLLSLFGVIMKWRNEE